jgi:hypothetical protein
MIAGIHASIAVARTPEEIRAILDQDGWPWLGRPGPMMTREADLDGRPPQAFHVRVSSTRGPTRSSATWHLRLERPDAPPSPQAPLDLKLTLEPQGATVTRLRLDGQASHDLMASGGVTPRAAVRLAACAYARSLVEQVAAAVERQRPSTPERAAGRAPKATPVKAPR